MGKNRAPPRQKPPAAKRNFSAVKPVVSDPLAAFKHSQEDITHQDREFLTYMASHPLAGAAFSPEIMETAQTAKDVFPPVPDMPEVRLSDLQNTHEGAEYLDEAATHAQDLKQLQQLDPEFYKFLQENDQELLGFGSALDADLQNEDDVAMTEQLEDSTANVTTTTRCGTQMTAERFNGILHTAQCTGSYRGLALLLTAFRCAVRSVTADRFKKPLLVEPSTEVLLEKKRTEKTKRKFGQATTAQRQKAQPLKLLFWIDFAQDSDSTKDEGMQLFYTISESVINNVSSLLARKFNLKEQGDAGSNNTTTPVSLPKEKTLHKRAVLLINHFWADVALLLQYCYNTYKLTDEFQQRILVQLASPNLLRWLVPARDYIIEGFADSIIRLWLEARRRTMETMDTPLAGFLVLRNLSKLLGTVRFHTAAAPFRPQTSQPVGDRAQEAQQTLLTHCYRNFIHLVGKIGYASVVYRICFLAVRQLGLCVRNAIVARSHGIRSTNKSATKEPERLRARKIEDTSRKLYNWSFIYATRLMIAAISKFKETLRPLSFPLSSVLTSSIKIDLDRLTNAPFTLECLKLQCDLMSVLGIFIPLGSHLLAFGTTLITFQDRLAASEYRSVKGGNKTKSKTNKYRNSSHIDPKNQHLQQQHRIEKPTATASIAKPPDIDAVLRLSDLQLRIPQTAELLVSRWLDVSIDHLGLLSRHPSFPEVIIPLVFNFKKLTKCKSDITRTDLKQLLSQCATSATEVRQKRFNIDLTKAASLEGNLLVFKETEISLSQLRATRLRQKAQRIALRIDLESKIFKEEEVVALGVPTAENKMLDVRDDESVEQGEHFSEDDCESISNDPDRDEKKAVQDVVEEFDLDSNSTDDEEQIDENSTATSANED